MGERRVREEPERMCDKQQIQDFSHFFNVYLLLFFAFASSVFLFVQGNSEGHSSQQLAHAN